MGGMMAGAWRVQIKEDYLDERGQVITLVSRVFKNRWNAECSISIRKPIQWKYGSVCKLHKQLFSSRSEMLYANSGLVPSQRETQCSTQLKVCYFTVFLIIWCDCFGHFMQCQKWASKSLHKSSNFTPIRDHFNLHDYVSQKFSDSL